MANQILRETYLIIKVGHPMKAQEVAINNLMIRLKTSLDGMLVHL